MCNTALKAYCKDNQLQRHGSSTAARRRSRTGSNNDSFTARILFLWLFLTKSSRQCLNFKLFLLLKNVINNYSGVFPFSVSMLAFITLPNLLLTEGSGSFIQKQMQQPLYSSWYFYHSLIVTFITLPYIEMIQYMSLFVREKGKLDTYCPFGKLPPVFSAGVGL